jgi:hypothetical protein
MTAITFIVIIIALTLGVVLRADAQPISRRARERRYLP